MARCRRLVSNATNTSKIHLDLLGRKTQQLQHDVMLFLSIPSDIKYSKLVFKL